MRNPLLFNNDIIHRYHFETVASYTERIELPLLIILAVVNWLAIGIRVWVVSKNMEWRTWHGASTIVISFGAVSCTVYVALVGVIRSGESWLALSSVCPVFNVLE